MKHIWWACPKYWRFWIWVYAMVNTILHTKITKESLGSTSAPTDRTCYSLRTCLNHPYFHADETDVSKGVEITDSQIPRGKTLQKKYND